MYELYFRSRTERIRWFIGEPDFRLCPRAAAVDIPAIGHTAGGQNVSVAASKARREIVRRPYCVQNTII